MNAHRMHAGRKVAFRTSVWVASAALLAACGGGSSAGGGSSSGGAATAGGKPIRTAGGQSVTAAAHNYWTEGLRAFKANEAKGWNDSSCDNVVGQFEEASEAQPKFAEALYMAGLTQDRCGRKKEANSFYNQALRANSKFCKARVALALDRLQSGQDSSAEREFAQAVQDDPQCTEGYVNLAILQRRRGLSGNKEALANLRRALAIDAQYLPAFNEMALLYLSEAEGNTKKLDLAEVVCSQAQKIDANYAPIYNTWGLLDLKRDKIIDAAAKFQRALELDGKMFEAYMNFARITIGFRGYQDARAAYEKALSLRPGNFEAQLGLGVALRGLEDNAKAQEAYEKATKMQPNRAEPYYNLGVLHQDFMGGTADEMKKARSYYEQFLSRAGSDKRYSVAVEEIQRKCKSEGKRRQGKNACVAGRLQNIQLYLDTMKQMAEMEKLQKEGERQAAELEAQEKAQQKAAESAAPAAPGKTTK